MKNLCALLIAIVSFSMAHAQEQKPELLKQPANWEFERFNLPPGFAPGITYKGAEELRFAPGMFQKDSANYFTYVFVAELDSVSAVSKADIRDYLLKYYKGLCYGVAKDRKLVIDTSQITVAIEKKDNTTGKETIYNASTNIFGVFTDGAPVKLNLEEDLSFVHCFSPRKDKCDMENTLPGSKGVYYA
jgi:hypothetical protein